MSSRRTDRATPSEPRRSSRSSASRSIRAGSIGAHTISELVARVRRADARRARGRAASRRRRAAGFWRFGRSARRTSWCCPTACDGFRSTSARTRCRRSTSRSSSCSISATGSASRAAVPHEDQRVHDLGVARALPREVPAAAAGEVARPDRRRDPVPAALPRSDRQPRRAAGVRDAQPHHRGDPRVHDRARLPRGRDADDAADRRRRARAAVHDASQRARHGSVPAHRAGALSEAADRRRHRAGVRDQPQLPERGDLDAAQPRVHDDGVLRGLRRLPAS